jgi:hypothetical protein
MLLSVQRYQIPHMKQLPQPSDVCLSTPWVIMCCTTKFLSKNPELCFANAQNLYTWYPHVSVISRKLWKYPSPPSPKVGGETLIVWKASINLDLCERVLYMSRRSRKY